MYKKLNKSIEQSLFFSFHNTLYCKHPLYMLATKVDWQKFEESFSPLYCKDNGRPDKPIRLMEGLILLRHLRDISRERGLRMARKGLLQLILSCQKQS